MVRRARGTLMRCAALVACVAILAGCGAEAAHLRDQPPRPAQRSVVTASVAAGVDRQASALKADSEEGFALRRRARPSPFVTAPITSFVADRSDFARSALLASVIVPLVVLLLVEREVLTIAGRRQTLFLVFILPLLVVVAVLVYVRVRVYAGA